MLLLSNSRSNACRNCTCAPRLRLMYLDVMRQCAETCDTNTSLNKSTNDDTHTFYTHVLQFQETWHQTRLDHNRGRQNWRNIWRQPLGHPHKPVHLVSCCSALGWSPSLSFHDVLCKCANSKCGAMDPPHHDKCTRTISIHIIKRPYKYDMD